MNARRPRPARNALALFFSALLLVSGAGGAQGIGAPAGGGAPSLSSPVSSVAGPALLGSVNRKMLESLTKGPAKAAKPAPRAGTAFKAGAPVMPRKLAASMGGADAAKMEELFTGLLGAYDSFLEGGEADLKNNVAGAYAYAVLAGYYVVSGGQELAEAQQQGVLDTAVTALSGAPEFQKMPAAKRQEMYEALIISGGLALALYSDGTEGGNADSLQQAKDMAEGLLAQLLGADAAKLLK